MEGLAEVGAVGLTKVENWTVEVWSGPRKAFVPEEHLC